MEKLEFTQNERDYINAHFDEYIEKAKRMFEHCTTDVLNYIYNLQNGRPVDYQCHWKKSVVLEQVEAHAIWEFLYKDIEDRRSWGWDGEKRQK